MATGETKEQFQARMRSIGVMVRVPKVKEKIIVRDDGLVDNGKRAKVVTDELGSTITVSDNRQDANIVPPTVYQDLTFMGEQ